MRPIDYIVSVVPIERLGNDAVTVFSFCDLPVNRRNSFYRLLGK